MPEGANIHLDRGYDSKFTRLRLQERELIAEVSEKGNPTAPLNATKRWVVWCTERRERVVNFWVVFSDVIIVRRLVREGWTRYRWEGRPSQRP